MEVAVIIYCFKSVTFSWKHELGVRSAFQIFITPTIVCLKCIVCSSHFLHHTPNSLLSSCPLSTHSKVWKWISHVVSLLPLPLHTFCLGQGVEHLVQYFTDTAWYSNTFFNMKSTCWPQRLHAGLCGLTEACTFTSPSLHASLRVFSHTVYFYFLVFIGWRFAVAVKLFLLQCFIFIFNLLSLLVFILKIVFCYCAVGIFSLT